MKICFIPIDNRPVCYNLAKDIAAIDEDIELFIPQREFLGDLKKNADMNEMIRWVEKHPKCEAVVIALDTVAYGGLIPSRRSNDEVNIIKTRIGRLKVFLRNKKNYAFSSIMRISNNNYNEEEKYYWKDYGEKIFEYSYSGMKNNDGIPPEILADYLRTRLRNYEINETYLGWQKEGVYDTLIFSKDDCAPQGINVEEAKRLEAQGATTKTGADEIPLTLLARAIEKEIKVFVQYTEPEFKHSVSNYEDVSIEQSVLGQLELGGFTIVEDEAEADLVLVVNNFVEKQGEHVMGWETQPFNKTFTVPDKPYAVADVRYANGADNDFVNVLLPQIDLKNFYGYSGWNTSANTLGSLLAGVKVRWNAGQYNEDAFKRLQMIRFLDDWAYQANVRVNGKTPDIADLMRPYEEKLSKALGYELTSSITYSYPWKRSFEVEVSL